MSVLRREEDLRLGPVRAEELESFLPLVEAYQRFCEVEHIERGRNRGFFGRLIAPSQFGMLLGAWRGTSPVGYACLHWCLNSALATETVKVHDLWVQPEARRRGVGRALIDEAADIARARGAHALVCPTRPEDFEAHRLFGTLGATASERVLFNLGL